MGLDELCHRYGLALLAETTKELHKQLYKSTFSMDASITLIISTIRLPIKDLCIHPVSLKDKKNKGDLYVKIFYINNH